MDSNPIDLPPVANLQSIPLLPGHHPVLPQQMTVGWARPHAPPIFFRQLLATGNFMPVGDTQRSKPLRAVTLQLNINKPSQCQGFHQLLCQRQPTSEILTSLLSNASSLNVFNSHNLWKVHTQTQKSISSHNFSQHTSFFQKTIIDNDHPCC